MFLTSLVPSLGYKLQRLITDQLVHSIFWLKLPKSRPHLHTILAPVSGVRLPRGPSRTWIVIRSRAPFSGAMSQADSSQPKGRKLKARNSCEREVQIECLPCIQGGWLKEPRVLPTTTFRSYGRFVPVTSKDTWLHEVLAGVKCSEAARDASVACLDDLKKALLSQAADASDLSAVEVASLRDKLRHSGVSDDEEEEEVHDEDLEEPAARPQRPRRGSGKTPLQVRHVCVKEQCVVAAKHSRQILLQYSPENIKAFVGLLLKYTKTDIDEKKKARVDARHSVPDDSWFH